MKNTILILFIVSISFVSAQTTTGVYDNYKTMGWKINAFELDGEDFRDNTEGSPYLIDDFITADIYENNKLTGKSIKARVNLFNNEIEIKDPNAPAGEELGALIKSEAYSVVIFNSHYYYTDQIKSVDNSSGVYLKKLIDLDNISLNKFEKIEYFPAYAAKTSYEKDKKAAFRKSSEYYMKDIGGNYSEFPTKKNQLINKYNKSKKLKKYLKENKINLKDENELKKVFTFIIANNINPVKKSFK